MLGVERVGPEDGFFDLGGHSLLATRLVSRVREVFAVELALQEVFAQPTVADLARNLESALGSGRGVQLPPLRRVPRDGALPLSFAQQRLWFLDRLEPGGIAYNLATAVRLVGALDRGAFARALAEVVRRHESLRTTFDLALGDPVQVIGNGEREALPLLDLGGLAEPARQIETARLSREGARLPFDLAAGPLFRAALVAAGQEEHLFLLAMHHIVSDAWSLEVLTREISVLYASFRQGAASPLPELAIQYADFAAWQRSRLSGEVLASEIAFWRELLAGVPPLLELPGDRPRPSLKASAGAIRSFALSPDLVEALQVFSRQQGATLFMTLLAVFQALLSRHSGQRRLAIGTPIAGRAHLASEDLIGLFVNTLVLPGDLSGEPSFAAHLGRTRRTTIRAFAHQDLPFEKLVEELQPERDLSRTPLFQVMLALQNTPVAPLAAPGLLLEPVAVEPGSEKFDLTLSLAERAGRLAGALSYRTDLFDETTIARLLRHFEVLLRAALESPESPLSRLPLLTPGERHELRVEWNDTRRAEPAAAHPLPRLFAAQAARTPAAAALVGAAETLDYRELDGRANRLARHLRRRGVGPGARVGVLLERSPEMVVALLGVLAAGGAYVPLDPADPRPRLAFVAADARIDLLLTRQGLAADLAPAADRLLLLDAAAAEISRENPAALPLAVDGDDLAYVIYTSGSTGTPKGVQIPHRALVNFLLSMGERLGIGPADRLVAVTTPSFDIAALELFLPLLVGGCVVVATREETRDGRLLADRLAATRATVLQATPATWRLLLEAGWTGQPGLQALCGGEALPRSLAARLLDGGEALWNLYGPTETTVWSTVSRVGAGDGAVDLGRPIANTAAHLLDFDLEPLPIGVEGDLYLGGAGLSWGYLGRPDLTAERFIPDPFADGPGGRLYRTGDRARHLPGGALDFRGRSDHQVKVQGFRIEPGEVEAALVALPAVREAAVVARGEGEDRHLAAFMVPEPGQVPAAAELREALAGQLPRHMVPGTFTLLKELPQTPNGKVDRQALVVSAPGRAAARPYARPRSVTELELVQLWEELLSARPIGIDDSFFELGGHSLLSVRLMMRIKSRWGRDLPLSTLFAAPTVRGLARRLERQGSGRAWSPLVAIHPRGSRPPLFFVHPIGGEVLCFYHLAQHLGADQPFFGFQATPLSVGGSALGASIEAMASEYVAALRSVRPRGPYRLGGWSFGGLVAFEMAQQLERAGERISLLTLLDTPVPLGRAATALDSAALVSALAREQARQNGRDLALTAEELRGLPLAEQLETVLARLGDLRAVEDSEIDVPTLVRLIDGHRARHHAFESYRPRPYPGRIVLFRPYEIDPEHLRQASAEELRQIEDPTLGWGSLAGEIRVQHVPGYHETLALPPHVAELASALRGWLDEADRSAGASPAAGPPAVAAPPTPLAATAAAGSRR